MATIVPRTGKSGTRYTAQIRIKRNGERYTESKTFDSKRAAERWAAKREAELEAPGAIRKAKAEGVTVGEVIRNYIKEFDVEYRYGRSKFADLNRLLKSELAQLPADSLQSSDYVVHIKERRAEGAGPSTASSDLVWLRVVAKTARPAWGVDWDLQQIDDAAALCRKAGHIARPGKRLVLPTLDEMNQIMQFFESGWRYEMPIVDIVLFALFSTRRQDEITRLKRSNLDRPNKRILVEDMKDPRSKKGNDRWVTLTDEALAIIDRQPAGDVIFPYNPNSISANFTRCKKTLGLHKDIVFHTLRHEGITWLFQRGWQIPQVAMVSGHRTWQSLQRYTHLIDNDPYDKYEGWRWRPSCDEPTNA